MLGPIAFAMSFIVAPGAAQTRFAWPDTTVDVSRYTTIEECQAAIGRVAEGTATQAELTSGNWRDTMPPDLREFLEPLPQVVAETVRRCLTRFAAVDTVPLKYFKTLAPLYVIAGWDAKARALVDRRFAAVGPKSEDELAAVIDSVSDIYAGGPGIRVRPPQLATAEEIVATYTPRVSDRTKRLRLYLNLLLRTASEWKTDRTRVDRILKRTVAIADSLTVQERASLKGASLMNVDLAIDQVGNLQEQLYAVLNEALGKQVLLDSLRRSTATFVALKRENWVRVTRRPPAAFDLPIGQRAPAIQGDFWLGRGGSTGPRPSPGRVSLVAFVNRGAGEDYADNLIALRRLAIRFPQLELTVVAQSRGYFMYLKDSITPAREAELTKQWLESFGVQAALAMTSNEFFRLPAPDGRRINRAVANRTNYSFGKTWPTSSNNFSGATFLVDPEGIVVHASTDLIDRRVEAEFAELIEVLLLRGKP
jgi:hypothetical protein